ncbi:hypothetical protein [Nitrosomonas nitrosa]|uniref:hypothetical protein n=1 Tax=Nitrosomonas nitrosa TaxID=52442 RepID=UPI000D327CE0|nr:hypothetical protein [Nitrosomonas nitrosa]
MTGYLVLLPSDGVRHVEKSRAFDGGKQRPIQAEDFTGLMDDLLYYEKIAESRTTNPGNKTFVVTRMVNGEQRRIVFEIMGKKIKAISLLSMVIKNANKR